MILQILTICWILEAVCAKNLEATLLFIDFSQGFDSIHRGKIEQILLTYGLLKETLSAIMMWYKNTKVKVRSLDGDRLLWHCSRCATRRYISPIPVYYLLRLCAPNVNRLNERKRLYKGKMQKMPRTNNSGHGLCWWHSASGKYTHPGQIPAT